MSTERLAHMLAYHALRAYERMVLGIVSKEQAEQEAVEGVRSEVEHELPGMVIEDLAVQARASFRAGGWWGVP